MIKYLNLDNGKICAVNERHTLNVLSLNKKKCNLIFSHTTAISISYSEIKRLIEICEKFSISHMSGHPETFSFKLRSKLKMTFEPIKHELKCCNFSIKSGKLTYSLLLNPESLIGLRVFLSELLY